MTLFSDGKYENETFESIEQRGAIEDVEFYNCVFRNSSFQSCRLIKCCFEQCEFIQCNLSLVEIVHTSFLDALFSECKMIGVSWSATGGFLSASYDGSILNNNVFADMNLTKFRFSSCSFVEAAFHDTKLIRAVFDDCDLSGCQFSQTDLSFADFTTSRNYYVDAANNILKKTQFSLPEATSLLKNLDIVLK